MTRRILMLSVIAVLAAFPAAASPSRNDYDPQIIFERTIARADSLYAEERYEAAADATAELLEDNRLFQHQRWPLHQRAGLALQKLGRHEEALVHLEQAVIWAQAVAANHRNLATLMVEMDRPGRALSEYREACELDPGNWIYRLEYGQLLVDYGQDAAAERVFAEAAAACPECPEVPRARSRLYLERGDHAAALPHLERAFELRPEDREVRSLLALSRLRSDQAEAALALLGPFWSGGPGDRDARIILEADRRLGRTDRALSLALSLGDGTAVSTDPDLWAQAALVCIDAGRDEEALALIDRALLLAPRHTGYLNNRILLLRRLGREGEADRDWDLLIAIDPSRADAPDETP